VFGVRPKLAIGENHLAYCLKPEIQEECGVFGVYAAGEDVARLTFFGLFALQHRGQESAGIAVSNGRDVLVYKDMGLVTQVFDEEILRGLKGHLGVGHTRYSTTGSSVLRNVQPILVQTPYGTLALAHNGDLINAAEVRAELALEGVDFESTSDSEVIAKLIALSKEQTLEGAVKAAMQRIQGAYSLVMLTEDKMLAARDPNGIRPLCLGELNGSGYVFSSESCALNVVGARFAREVEPGEIISVDRNGLHEMQAVPPGRPAICIFEFFYFARPDSKIYNRSIHEARLRCGHELAREHPCRGAHVVFPIPDTGTPAAIGYAQASHIPYGEGVIKNRYIHRTFIQPGQRMRELGVKMKLTPLRETLAGKRVVMVEDSIVRGTTTAATVGMLREAGANEVHVRIASPPYKHPCFFGIDTANQDELVASRMSVEGIRDLIGADSLGYLSLNGLVKAIGLSKNLFCSACLDGKYPIEISKKAKLSKLVFEEESDPVQEKVASR